MLRRDDGQLTVLVIVYAAVALGLLLVAIDVSALFLARRNLANVADGAALAGTTGVDRAALYRTGGTNGLPLSDALVVQEVARYLDDSGALLDYPGLRWTVATDGTEVTVTLLRSVTLPPHLLAVPVSATAHATAAAG